MSKDEDINELKLKMDDIVEGIRKLSEKQNLQYTDIMMELKGNTNNNMNDEELYEEAKDVVIEMGKASTSFLQRMFRIGYAKAAQLIDKLEEGGVIGPGNGAKPREILIKSDDTSSTRDLADEDELYNEAKEIVINAGKASSSFLQRKLRIGYARAARLMDILEEEKVIIRNKSGLYDVLIKTEEN